MIKRIFSLLLLLTMILGTTSVFAAEEGFVEYFDDLNSAEGGYFNHVVDQLASTPQEIPYQGRTVTWEQEENGNKYYSVTGSQDEKPYIFYTFPEPLRGKVVVEADVRLSDLGTARNIFHVYSGTTALVRLRANTSRSMCFMYYSQSSIEVDPIAFNNVWVHYMAVIDTNKNTFMLYSNGRPIFAEPTQFYKDAKATAGITSVATGHDSTGAYENHMDNIRWYSLDLGEYQNISGDGFEFDHKYLTVSGAYKGMSVGELISSMKTDADLEIRDKTGRTRKEDEVIGVRDLLLVTKGRQRSFYAIRLEENEHDGIMRADSPELFVKGERTQHVEDDSAVMPYMKGERLYIPVRTAEKIFEANVLYDGDANTVTIKKEDIKFDAKSVPYEYKGGSLYVDVYEMSKKLNYNCFYDGDLFAVDRKKTGFAGSKHAQYLKETFLFQHKADAKVISEFSTLNEAVEKANAIWESGFNSDIIIDLKDRKFVQHTPFRIFGDVMKNGSNRLIFRGDEKNRPIITGGMELDPNDFKPVTDVEVKKKFPAVSADYILEYDLTKAGVNDIGVNPPGGLDISIRPSAVQFYSDRITVQPARWPNDSNIKTGKSANAGKATLSSGKGDNKFYYTQDRISSWSDSDDKYAFGWWHNHYCPSYSRIKAIDKEKKIVTLADVLKSKLSKTGRPFYFYNVIEELDIPGECYLDRKANKIYYYPTETFGKEPLYVSVTNKPIVEVNKCKNIVFENIDISYSRDECARVNNSENVLFNKCKFLGAGTYGASFLETVNSGVNAGYFYQAGSHAVLLEGGDTPTLTKGNNFAMNSKFEETGYRRPSYGASVFMRGCGNYTYKNRFQDHMHLMIYVFGSLHTIKNNSLSNACYETGDSSAIYMCGRFSTSMTTVEGNYFENMDEPDSIDAHVVNAVYYDNNTSVTTTYGNVFYNVYDAVYSNCGRENVVQGNIFSDSRVSAKLNAGGFLPTEKTLDMIPYKGKIWEKLNPRLFRMDKTFSLKTPYETMGTNNVVDNTKNISSQRPDVIRVYDNIGYKKDEVAFMGKADKDFRLREHTAYENTYIYGATDLKNIGPSKDLTFYTKNDLARLYLTTDLSASAQANVRVALNEKFSLHLFARSSEDDYVDLKNAKITYTSSNPEFISVSENGTVNPHAPGKATITATVNLGLETKSISIVLYSDEALWDKANDRGSTDVLVYLNNELTQISHYPRLTNGMLYVPFNEIMRKLGYEEKKTGAGYRYEYRGQVVEIAANRSVVSFNGVQSELINMPYEFEGELYAPYTVFEKFDFVPIFTDTENRVDINRINRAIDNDKEVIPEGANVVDISELLRSDPDGWTNEKTKGFRRESDGGISFGYQSSSSSTIFSYEKAPFPVGTMFKFKMKTLTTSYIAFIINAEKARTVPWRTDDVDSYYVIIKPKTFEVQKRINNEQCFLIDSVPNTALTFDQWHDVSIGTALEGDVVRVIINADGKNVVDLRDTINYSTDGTANAARSVFSPNLDMVTTPGYFGIYIGTRKAAHHFSLK